MYRKFTLFIALSAIPLLLLVFSFTPQDAQATSRNGHGPSQISGPPPLALLLAASQKNHAGTDFFILMPLSATLFGSDSGIESREGGDSNGGGVGDYLIVFSFNNAITGTGAASVTFNNPVTASGTAGAATVSGNDVLVPLSGVTNGQVLTLHVEDVTDGTDTIDVDVNVGFLIGDTTGNRAVNSSDISQTKATSGAVISPTNARIDVTVSGDFSAADIAEVKASSGTAAP